MLRYDPMLKSVATLSMIKSKTLHARYINVRRIEKISCKSILVEKRGDQGKPLISIKTGRLFSTKKKARCHVRPTKDLIDDDCRFLCLSRPSGSGEETANSKRRVKNPLAR